MTELAMLPKIHTLSFCTPHWELVFSKKLAIGDLAVKTRKDDKYGHRGLILCYTSLGSHEGPIRSHCLNKDKIPRGVVGCARIVEVRKLANYEKDLLFSRYNNISLDTGDHELAQEILRDVQQRPDAIWPMDYGYFMKPIHRFKKPFVPYRQFMFGPVGNIPLFLEIERQLPKWALKLI